LVKIKIKKEIMSGEFIFRCWDLKTGKRININKKPLKHYFYEVVHIPTGKLLVSTGNECNNSFRVFEYITDKHFDI
jgi:hypothetical protein